MEDDFVAGRRIAGDAAGLLAAVSAHSSEIIELRRRAARQEDRFDRQEERIDQKLDRLADAVAALDRRFDEHPDRTATVELPVPQPAKPRPKPDPGPWYAQPLDARLVIALVAAALLVGAILGPDRLFPWFAP